MPSSEEFRIVLGLYRDAVEEYEAAAEAVLDLAEARGQSDSALPVVVSSDDQELAQAVQREIDAGEALDRARRQLAVVRGLLPRQST